MTEKYVITTEDDSDMTDGSSPAVVPFYMKEELTDGEFVLDVEVYEGARKIAEEFLEKYKGAYFKDEALLYIYERISAYMEALGYYPESGAIKRYYTSFEMREKSPLLCGVRDDSIFIDELDEGIKSSLTFDISELREKGLFAFVTVKDGRAVSIATVNEHSEDARMLEITTETAPAYRKNGYALSNVRALAAYLIDNGYSVAYCTSRYNRGSIKIAKKCGFTPAGRFYAVAGYND